MKDVSVHVELEMLRREESENRRRALREGDEQAERAAQEAQVRAMLDAANKTVVGRKKSMLRKSDSMCRREARAKNAAKNAVVRNRWRVVMGVSSAIDYIKQQVFTHKAESKLKSNSKRRAMAAFKNIRTDSQRRSLEALKLKSKAGETLSFKSRRTVIMDIISKKVGDDSSNWMETAAKNSAGKKVKSKPRRTSKVAPFSDQAVVDVVA